MSVCRPKGGLPIPVPVGTARPVTGAPAAPHTQPPGARVVVLA
eukprot:gene6715-20166_t